MWLPPEQPPDHGAAITQTRPPESAASRFGARSGWWGLLVIVVVLAGVSVISAGRQALWGGGSHGLALNVTSVQNALGTGTVSSCAVSGSSVVVAGTFQHGPGDVQIIGFANVQVIDSSGNVLGSLGRDVTSPFTSGTQSWSLFVPSSGSPVSCKVRVAAILPPWSPFLPSNQ
jgi:hypothetical protein